MVKRTICALLLASMMIVGWADELPQGQGHPADLTKFSLEDLMNVEITSASKKEQKLSQTAAAIYVITQEDIRRSGATSIPEALRMVPGLDVARINENQWAISARGFNDRFANKMLVMIDGRSVYTPAFSGVFWDVQDTLLEDIDRIEVIRGPGATVWGANAVNGVVNIITKGAQDTQGGLVTAGGGSEEQGFGSARYGGKLGRTAFYRVYAKYFNRDNLVDPAGRDLVGGWNALRGGFRMDWNASDRDWLTMQGDIYNGNIHQRQSSLISLSPPFRRALDDHSNVRGGNALARWKRTFSTRSDMALQLYYNRDQRMDADHDRTSLGNTVSTFDLDFQHHFAFGQRQDIIWGLGSRFVNASAENSFNVGFDPARRSIYLFSAFLQDETALIKDRLILTFGSKFEHSDFGGFEVQPSVRLLWKPYDRHMFWTAVSRAVRTPARGDWDLRVITAAFVDASGVINAQKLIGDRNFKSENLLAYEFGYRAQPSRQLSVDIATFYNAYNRLKTNEPGAPFFESNPPPLHRVIPLYSANKMSGGTYGVEIAPHWSVTSYWKLSMGYTWFRAQLRRDATSLDTSAEGQGGNNPKHQVQVRSYLNLPHNFALDTALYHVGRLANQNVPSYTRLDAQIGWHPIESLDLSIGLQNLLDARHLEFVGTGVNATQIKRSIYGKLLWRF